MKYVFPMPHTHRIAAIRQDWETDVTGPGQARLARRAEALGYDMLRIPEHHVIPRENVALSGAHYFHATAAQGYYAGATERIRIGTGVTLLPLQHPILMAKGLATIDWLSGGRIEVTFGVGWLEREFEAMGVPFHERGRIADEYIAAIIELWTQDYASYEGKYVSFRDVALEPKPVQKPHLPISMGGDSDAALKRAARYATGWTPFLTAPEDYPARIDFIKSQPTFNGGPFDVLHLMSGRAIGEGHVARSDEATRPSDDLDWFVDRIGYLKRQGVTIFNFAIPAVASVDAYLDYAQWFIEEVKPRAG
jgi:probable F420-dependent oxidoreductase